MRHFRLKSADDHRPGPGRTILVSALMAGLVAAVFLQVVTFDFINFDDPVYILDNRHIQQGLNPDTLKWAFTTHLHGHFHPLTWLSHTTDYLLFGLDPAGHHFTGFLFHLINTLLLFAVLRRMTGAVWTSAFAAALFGIHPLHVEPVAWVADRKDLLYGFFWISALWVYLRAVERQSVRYHLLLLLVYLLGLLSKSMMITLPLILLLLDYWPLRRFGTASYRSGGKMDYGSLIRPAVEKSGLLLIAGFFVMVSTGAMQDLHVESKPLAPHWQFDFVIFLRHYLEKFIWPAGLTVLYPYNENPANGLLILSGMLQLLLTLLIIRVRRRFPFLVTGWFWLLITLLPVAGIIHDGPHRIADRYTYIPLIGLCILLAWSWKELTGKRKHYRSASAVLAGMLILALSAVSFTQTGRWRSSIELFEHAVTIYPDNWIAHNNLGDALDRENRKEEALDHYLTALRLKPEYARAHYNLGNTLASLGREDLALAHFLKAVEFYPEFAEAHNNAGVLLGKQKRYLQAREHFADAVQLAPEYTDAEDNLRNISSVLDKLLSQLHEFRQKLATDPENANLHNNIGLLYREGGDREKAEQHFRKALQIDPAFAGAHNNLGILYAEGGRYRLAERHFRQAVSFDPDFAGARINLERIQSFVEKQETR